MKKTELIKALSELSVDAADQILGYHDEDLTIEAIQKTIKIVPRFLHYPLGPVTPGYIAYLLLKANDREEEYFTRYYNGPSMENKQQNPTQDQAQEENNAPESPDDDDTPVSLPTQDDVDTAYTETLYTLTKALAKAYAIPEGTVKNIDLHAISHARTEFANAITELEQRSREQEAKSEIEGRDPLAYKWLYPAKSILGLSVTAFSAANVRLSDSLPSSDNMGELIQARRTRDAMSKIMTDLDYIRYIHP